MLETALLTAAIESPLFFLLGFRNANDIILFAGVNIISNLLLNNFLDAIEFSWNLVAIGEIFVIILEFALCTYFINDRLKKLFATLIITNLSSFAFGLIFFD